MAQPQRGVRTVLTETRKSWVSVNQTESWVSVNQTESCESRRDGTTTWPQLSIRIKVLFAHALAPLQHTFRENRRLPAATGQPSPHVCLRSHRVRLRPYRQLPHLYRRLHSTSLPYPVWLQNSTHHDYHRCA